MPLKSFSPNQQEIDSPNTPSTYPPLDDLDDGVSHFAHGLALDVEQEVTQLVQQGLVTLKVVKVMVDPMAKHIDHSAGNVRFPIKCNSNIT